MNLLERSESYWNTVALPDLRKNHAEWLDKIAAGLVGNGSECFGYDDEMSKDHDYGVDFFIWLRPCDAELLPEVRAWKRSLLIVSPPADHLARREGAECLGVMTSDDFYRMLTGFSEPPEELMLWRRVPEENLAMAVNGKVFYDGPGSFSAVRNGFLEFYPEDLRLKKIAARCAAVGQTGQYNYLRMHERGELVTCGIILSRFASEAMGLVYHLNRVYRPYYKWTFRKLKELPVLGGETASALEELYSVEGNGDAAAYERAALMEKLCAAFADELRSEGLSGSDDDFLPAQAAEIQSKIVDQRLRALPVQFE